MENKLNLFLALFAHYSYAEVKDTTRLAKIAAGIDKMTDDLIKDIKIESPKQDVKTANESKPAAPPATTQNKSQQPVPQNQQKQNNQPAAKSQEEIDALKKAKADAAKAEADKKVADDKAKAEKAAADAKIAEVLTEVVPFYACEVMPKDAKYAKSVKVHAPRGFKAWEDEDAAKAAKLETLYPDMATLELVLDEAWEMACKCESSKAILEMCKKELKGFYPELKADSDWYSKLVNPIVAMVGFIKKAFGYKVDDKSVMVTRPMEKGLTLEFNSDCVITKPAAPVTPAPAKTEEKKELKTVQTNSTAKPAEKAKVDARVDEEEQETESDDDSPSLDLGDDDEEERDTTVPPAINEFDEFNEFETMVFEKLLEGAKLAKDAKDEASKKAIQAENKEEVRNLIASYYEDEPWTIKTDDGKWNPLLITYYTSIVNEISKNKEKWNKK